MSTGISGVTCNSWPRPEVTLGGIDFSGGQELEHRGNKKIWVAQWHPENGVSLRCGSNRGAVGPLRRRDLPALIDREGDAVDALVLLVSSWIAYLLPQDQWTEELQRLQHSGATVEGWFPIEHKQQSVAYGKNGQAGTEVCCVE